MANTKKNKPASVKSQDNGFRKLKFFEDFLALNGISYEEAAARISISRPTLSHWFAVDDTRLSLVQDVVKSAGYDFKIYMTKEEGRQDVPEKVDIEDIISLPSENVIPKRLSFLSFALKRYGIPKVELAERLGINYTTVRYWFQTDDITFGRLFDCAKVCGLSIRFEITKQIEQKKKGAGLTFTTLIQKETEEEF